MRSMIIIAVAACSITPAADAQDAASGITFDASAGVVSDYRYRGLSLSDEAPALQIDATLATDSGLYANAFASTIDEYGPGADGDGAQVEIDYALGWAFSVMNFDVDLAVSAYTYPGGVDVDYLTVPVAISRVFESWTLTLGVDYSPSQANLGDTDNTYVWLGADWADDDIGYGLAGWIGYENGAWAPDGKTDWSIGGYKTVGQFELGLAAQGVDVEDGVNLIGSLMFRS